MIHGVTNCTMLTPKLPMPAWMPRAVPCLAFGKKYEVLGMKPLNTPPPIPARKARTSRTVYEVFGFCTARAHPTSGMISSRLLIHTSLRVPMMGGRNIQTSRSRPPARPGMATSQ